MKKALFQINDGPIYMGYTSGARWNGWATPYFTFEEAQKLQAEFSKGAGSPMLYDVTKDKKYLDAAEFLEMHCKQMNRMLRDCGMSRIDPRNMFDYLVLYCLRPEDELFMSERMEALMTELF